MNLRLRPLLALGAVLFTAKTASAQFIDLVTEAPVTIQLTLTTNNVTVSATERKTTATVTRLSHAQVMEQLRLAGIIPGASIQGWSLVAVNNPPPDLAYIDAAFFLYAVNLGTGIRIAVPPETFGASASYSVEKYTERNQGQYVLSSKGTVTNFVQYEFNPTFTAGGNNYTLTESSSEGFATLQFVAKDVSDNYEAFFYAVNSIRATTRGGFTGTVQTGAGPAADTEGLISITLSVGAAKLVPASLYEIPPLSPLTDYPILENFP